MGTTALPTIDWYSDFPEAVVNSLVKLDAFLSTMGDFADIESYDQATGRLVVSRQRVTIMNTTPRPEYIVENSKHVTMFHLGRAFFKFECQMMMLQSRIEQTMEGLIAYVLKHKGLVVPTSVLLAGYIHDILPVNIFDYDEKVVEASFAYSDVSLIRSAFGDSMTYRDVIKGVFIQRCEEAEHFLVSGWEYPFFNERTFELLHYLANRENPDAKADLDKRVQDFDYN